MSTGRLRAAESGDDGLRCFFSGTDTHPIYVDRFAARRPVSAGQVVMVHGGFHTGVCYVATPDGRPGWARRFAEAGYDVFVPDWPGHGRSPMRPDFRILSCVQVAEALIALLEHVGPSTLLVHSASGPIAWWIAERRPELVRSIIALAPGPPANLLPVLPDDPVAVAALNHDDSHGRPIYAPEDKPVWINSEFVASSWTSSPRFPKHAVAEYCRSIVPESARVLNERFNIGGRGLRIEDPHSLRGLRILIMTGDCDPRHPRAFDQATAEYLGADFCWLADRGFVGNGHMFMIEDNSDALAALALEWLAR